VSVRSLFCFGWMDNDASPVLHRKGLENLSRSYPVNKA